MKKRFGDGATVEGISLKREPQGSQTPAPISKDLWQQLEQLVADHPKPSLIAALAAGALLGWFMRRR